MVKHTTTNTCMLSLQNYCLDRQTCLSQALYNWEENLREILGMRLPSAVKQNKHHAVHYINWTNTLFTIITHMWQSCVEIEGYFVAYLDCIAAFEAPHRWTSNKGGAHMHFVDSSDIHASTLHVWAPPLTEVQWYGTSSTAMRSKYVTNNLRFLHGTATYASQ